MRDFLPKCTRRDNMPLPIPANPCERTFLAVFLYERSPACAKGSDEDESRFFLPPSCRFWSTETTRGFLVICPPCYKKQNTQGDQEKKHRPHQERHLQPQGSRQGVLILQGIDSFPRGDTEQPTVREQMLYLGDGWPHIF